MVTTTSTYVPPYTPDEVNERFIYLAERCVQFLTKVTVRHASWNMGLDLLVMKNVAQSALDDVWRYKVYHLASPDKYSDAVKRSAYFTKWLVKLRPIYHQRSLTAADFTHTFDKQDKTILINEAFSLHVSLGSLATDVGANRIALSPAFMDNVLYSLHFRELNGDALIGMYQIIRDLAAKHSPVIIS